MSSKRARVMLMIGLALAFLGLRWFERREPWNSDDVDLFEFAVAAADGRHWVFGAPLESMGAGESGDGTVAHPVFRIGLLPFGLAAVRLFGASANAYYLVPLAFSLLGFCVIQWILLTRFGPRVAATFAAVHLAWPFELEHASIFLTDLPAAVFSILSLCLLDAAATRTGKWRIAFAALAGLCAWEVYLLRNNGLVLLAPAYLIFLWSRSTRVPTLVAIAVALLGVLGQQSFLVYRGFDWGYDWRAVRSGFAGYAPFLPVYSWGKFLVRQFTYQVSTFGHGFTGYLAALLMLASLALHLCMLRFERQVLLRALSAFGLFVWLSFSFSIYERVPGGVRAALPVNYRYIQTFTYSSLVVWAWAWCWLRERVARTRLSAPRQGLVVAALPGLLIAFSALALAIRAPETYRQGPTRRVVTALQQYLARASEPTIIAGTYMSLRALRLFCCGDSARGVYFREAALPELRALVEQESPALIVRDVARELMSARYLAAEARGAYRSDLEHIDERLWRRYGLSHVNEKYTLFVPPRRGDGAAPGDRAAHLGGPAPALLRPASPASSERLIKGTLCSVDPDGGEPSRTLVPVAKQSAACEYMWLADSRELSSSELAEADSQELVLRLRAEYEPPLTLRVDVVQHGASGVSRETARLQPGTSYVPVTVQAGVRALSLVYRLTGSGASSGQVARVQAAEWQALASPEAGETSRGGAADTTAH